MSNRILFLELENSQLTHRSRSWISFYMDKHYN
jgi:hypothetical protein